LRVKTRPAVFAQVGIISGQLVVRKCGLIAHVLISHGSVAPPSSFAEA
jgi:hypothetical protein